MAICMIVGCFILEMIKCVLIKELESFKMTNKILHLAQNDLKCIIEQNDGK